MCTACPYTAPSDGEGVSCEAGEAGEDEEEEEEEEEDEEEEEEEESEEGEEEEEEEEDGLVVGGTGFGKYAGKPLCLGDLVPVPHLSPSSDQLAKYWRQRYRLFSHYDDGVCLDRGMTSSLHRVI